MDDNLLLTGIIISNGNVAVSGKPPSSDGYKKPQNSRQKTGTNRRSVGNEGKTLEKVENQDEILEYKISKA